MRRGGVKEKEKKKYSACPRADRISLIVIVISWRGVVFGAFLTAGVLPYRWLFVRMSPRVIICLVTRPVDSLFGLSFLFSRFFLLSLSRLHAFLFVSLSRALFYFPKLAWNMRNVTFNTRTILFRHVCLLNISFEWHFDLISIYASGEKWEIIVYGVGPCVDSLDWDIFESRTCLKKWSVR